MLKMIAQVFAGLLFLLVVGFLLARTPDTDRADMILRYTTPASQFVDDGLGGEIHYRDEGRRDAPVLLLLHGANSSLHTWEALVKLLGGSYRLISLDMHGHGLTGPHGENRYDAAAKIAAATKVLDKAGVQQAIWVGNSMGGWVAWRAALAVPTRVSGLVLIDAAGAQGVGEGKPYLGARLARTWIGQTLLPQITPKILVRKSLEENYAVDSRLTDAVVLRYWEMLRFPGNRQAAVIAAGADREPRAWNKIGMIRVPTLLLWGAKDPVFPLTHAKAFEKAIPGARLISFDDAGHLPMEEVPEKTAGAIDAWMGAIVLAE